MRSTVQARVHRRPPRWSMLGIVVLAGLLAAGCGDDDDNGGGAAATTVPATGSGPTTTARAEPVRGGKLTFLHYYETRGFDPILSTNLSRTSSNSQFSAVFDSLVYVDLESGEVVNHIAESLTSNDGVTWTLKLRPNVKFTDGTAYDAEAVKFNWERIADPASRAATGAALNAAIGSLTVKDPLTLEITLKNRNGQFPRLVAERAAYIGSPTAIRERGEGFATNPVGAGPFVLTEWVRDGVARFQRNPNYWDAPRPYLDELEIRIIPDQDQRFNALVSGQGQMMENINPVLTKRAESQGYGADIYRPSGGLDVIFNMSRPPFDDVRARRAIAMALDMDGMNDVVFEGGGEPVTTLMREGHVFHDPATIVTKEDRAEAQRLLDALSAEKGRPLEFTLLATTETRQWWEYQQAQLSSMRNVRMNLQFVPGTELQPTLRAGNFEAGISGAIGTDPDLLYDHLHSSSPVNFSKYVNPEMDSALTTGRQSLSLDERKAAYKKASDLLVRDVPIVLTHRHYLSTIYDDEKVHDLTVQNVGPLWDEVWMSR